MGVILSGKFMLLGLRSEAVVDVVDDDAAVDGHVGEEEPVHVGGAADHPAAVGVHDRRPIALPGQELGSRSWWLSEPHLRGVHQHLDVVLAVVGGGHLQLSVVAGCVRLDNPGSFGIS